MLSNSTHTHKHTHTQPKTIYYFECVNIGYTGVNSNKFIINLYEYNKFANSVTVITQVKYLI